MSDLTPLSAAEEQLYRDGLRDAPSVAGLEPMYATLLTITVAEWADRCRRLLATLDAARVPVSPEGWKAAMDDPAFVAAVAEGRADLDAGRVKPFPVSPEGLDVERLARAMKKLRHDKVSPEMRREGGWTMLTERDAKDIVAEYAALAERGTE